MLLVVEDDDVLQLSPAEPFDWRYLANKARKVTGIEWQRRTISLITSGLWRSLWSLKRVSIE